NFLPGVIYGIVLIVFAVLRGLSPEKDSDQAIGLLCIGSITLMVVIVPCMVFLHFTAIRVKDSMPGSVQLTGISEEFGSELIRYREGPNREVPLTLDDAGTQRNGVRLIGTELSGNVVWVCIHCGEPAECWGEGRFLLIDPPTSKIGAVIYFLR